MENVGESINAKTQTCDDNGQWQDDLKEDSSIDYCDSGICNSNNTACGCHSSTTSTTCKDGVLTSCINGDWVNLVCPSGECNGDGCKEVSYSNNSNDACGCYNINFLQSFGIHSVLIIKDDDGECPALPNSDSFNFTDLNNYTTCTGSCTSDNTCGECVDGDDCTEIGGVCSCISCQLGVKQTRENPYNYSCKKSDGKYQMGECQNGYIKCSGTSTQGAKCNDGKWGAASDLKSILGVSNTVNCFEKCPLSSYPDGCAEYIFK